jgi:hypothetical protein
LNLESVSSLPSFAGSSSPPDPSSSSDSASFCCVPNVVAGFELSPVMAVCPGVANDGRLDFDPPNPAKELLPNDPPNTDNPPTEAADAPPKAD